MDNKALYLHKKCPHCILPLMEKSGRSMECPRLTCDFFIPKADLKKADKVIIDKLAQLLSQT